MPTKHSPEHIVNSFTSYVLSPRVVRLDPANYGGVNEYYLGDRKVITKDTTLLKQSLKEILFRDKLDLATALIEASKSEFSGRLSYDDVKGEWYYCAGQYQPTEIRRAAYFVVRKATIILAKL